MNDNGTNIYQKTVPVNDLAGEVSTTMLYLTKVGDNFYVRTRFWTVKRFRSQAKAEAFFNHTWDLRPTK